MRLVFIGESWRGSCARGICEALARLPSVEIENLAEDAWFPKPRSRILRVVNRLTHAAYQREFGAAVLRKVEQLQPDAVVVYKGKHITLELVQALQRRHTRVVNVYPDYSPHNQGTTVRRALGAYDLVISTKVYQPDLWSTTYGYTNRCIFIPQGYDPLLHLYDAPRPSPPFDVCLVATRTPAYGRLMRQFADHLNDRSVKVAIGGNGWQADLATLPSHWAGLGEVTGTAYVEALRSAHICIAPLRPAVSIAGVVHPGDVDTTRTYELAAAYCFFIHLRTDYVRSIYDEEMEVPMYGDPKELASKVRFYLSHPELRAAMAAAAHCRAVPHYSNDMRAAAIVDAIRTLS